MKMVKKRFIFVALFALLIISFIVTNPTKQDHISYTKFSEEQMEESFDGDVDVKIEEINFYIFSTYTPVVAREHGITHLGAFGHFFQISEGQFDYPWWLGFFN